MNPSGIDHTLTAGIFSRKGAKPQSNIKTEILLLRLCARKV
jgi:hypothetical protein